MKETLNRYINDVVSTDRDLREIKKSVYTGVISPVEGANRIERRFCKDENN